MVCIPRNIFPSLGKLLFQSSGDVPEESDNREKEADIKSQGMPRRSPPLALDKIAAIAPVAPTVTPRSSRGPPSSKEFRKTCSEVIPAQLYVAGWLISESWADLESREITHIVNTAGSVSKARFSDRIKYLTLPIEDSKTEDIQSYFYACIDFIESAYDSGGRVLIHCMEGVSRSCTVAMAYLMWKRKLSYPEAQAFVQAARPICQPNAGFICQLLSFHKRLMKQPETEVLSRITVRACALTSIVLATAAQTTSPSDPRFAYICQRGEKFYIWIDRNNHLYRHLERLASEVIERICRVEDYPICVEVSLDPFSSTVSKDHSLDHEVELVEAYLYPENVARQSHRSDKSSDENPFTARSHRSIDSEAPVKVFQLDNVKPDLRTPIAYFDSDDLDSRCAYLFVVLGTKTCVVWTGDEAAGWEDGVDSTSISKLRELFGSDYEIYIVRQGEETNDFWDLFQEG